MLKSNIIAKYLSNENFTGDVLRICPKPNIEDLKKSGSAAIDFRLGCWFSTMRQAKTPCLNINDPGSETMLLKHHYVHFGKEYFLHPRCFVLGVTLEWFKLPSWLGAYVIGKSSWGRRGLLIATASGVHPGFTGCITLEITNVAEVPIAIRPGMMIGQLFFHKVDSDGDAQATHTALAGSRMPILGEITEDTIAEKLRTTK